MPTTFSNLVPVRRVAVGDCSGPLGSGFDALARSAYTALRAAEWTQSADPPFLPVHDNGQTANKTIPRGDAWKCSYGYDAAARTERSACGAVCYTFAIPSDATAGTPANISTVSLSLTGDRYLDAGVDLYLVPSASATPPSVADLLALTPIGTYCATSDQSPAPQNERHGVTEAVEAALGVAAQPYIHVALLLHDYTTNRGAWIEGGAMLEGAAATIVFSREVSTTPSAGSSATLFRVGMTPSDNAENLPALQYFERRAVYGTNGSASDTPDSATVRKLYDYFASGKLLQLSSVADNRNDDPFGVSDCGAGIFSGEGAADAYVEFDVTGTPFYTPPGRINGFRFSFGVFQSYASRACKLRVGLVQSDTIFPLGTTGWLYGPNADELIDSVVPWKELITGGPNVVGVVDATIPTASTASAYAPVEIPVDVEPTKKYLWLCALPYPGGEVGMSKMSGMVSKWHIESVPIA
jgi:hypothetical protein